MFIEHSIIADASPSRIFAIYADVPRWCRWDPDTKASHLDGPFAEGTRGRLAPAKGNAVPMLLTQVVQDRCFTVESAIPGFRMVFEHELEPEGERTRIVHRVTFSGPLAFLLGRLIRRQLQAGLPVTLANLKAAAEAA